MLTCCHTSQESAVAKQTKWGKCRTVKPKQLSIASKLCEKSTPTFSFAAAAAARIVAVVAVVVVAACQLLFVIVA